MEVFNQNLTKFTFFINILNHFKVSCKTIESLNFAQGVNFELLDSLKMNGTKYLLTFNNSCEEIRISKELLNSLLLEDVVN